MRQYIHIIYDLDRKTLRNIDLSINECFNSGVKINSKICVPHMGYMTFKELIQKKLEYEKKCLCEFYEMKYNRKIKIRDGFYE